MWEDYEKEQTEIRASERLKARTLEQMNARSAKTRLPFFQPRSVLLVACSFLAIFFIGMQWLGQDSGIVFERVDSNPRHFLPTGEAVTMEQFEWEVGSRLSDITFSDLSLDMERSGWFWEEEAPLDARAIYVFSNQVQDLEIALHYSDRPLITNSTIEGQAVSLYYHETLLQTTYTAVFIVGDHFYRVQGSGLTEAEFIGLLRSILTFLE